MLASNINGLKYPDEALTRFFFKSGLNDIKESVLELGCNSGNNLRLFYEYGWDVTGVDLCKTSLSAAEENLLALQQEYQLKNRISLVHDDMLHFFESTSMESVHTVLFPSSLFYLAYADIVRTLEILSKKIRPGGYLFLKVLTDSDYRFTNVNKEKISEFSYRINFIETGEYSQIITFLSREQWQSLLEKYFVFESLDILDLDYESVQNGITIRNSNIICYGRLVS